MSASWVGRALACFLVGAGLVGCVPALPTIPLPKNPLRKDTPGPWVSGAEAVKQVESVGDVYVGLHVTRQNQLEVVSFSGRTGKVLERSKTDPAVDASDDFAYIDPAIAGNVVTYDATEHLVTALDPATFEKRWEHRGQITKITDCGPAVCVRTGDDTVLALDGTNGQRLWDTGDGEAFAVGEAVASVSDSASRPDTTVTVRDPRTGKSRWTVRPLRESGRTDWFEWRPFGDGRGLLQTYTENERPVDARLYDMTSGKQLWRREGLAVRRLGDTVVGTGADEDTVHILDPATGEDRWTAKPPPGHRMVAWAEPAIGTDGRIWQPVERAASPDETVFAPVDERRKRLGTPRSEDTTVVLWRAPQWPGPKVSTWGGTPTEKLYVPDATQPFLVSTGDYDSWPEKRALPTVARAFGKQRVAVIDDDGYPVLERVG